MRTEPLAPRRRRRPVQRLVLATAPLLLAACASVDPQAAFAPVARTVAERLGQAPVWLRDEAAQAEAAARSAELLARPLTAEAALQLALLNHRGLQARFEQLGVAEAERVQATRLPNPGLSLGRFRQGAERETEARLGLDLLRLLLLPALGPIEDRRLAEQQQALAREVLAHAASVRRAWIDAVAAEQRLRYRREVRDAAEAGAELARRMAAAGNFNALRQAREQAFHAEATLALAQAEQAQQAARERLVRLLGLWGPQTAFVLPERLPELPPEAEERPAIEQEAVARRLDLAQAREELARRAAELGLGRSTRWTNALTLGLEQDRSNEGPDRRGLELGIELPLFDRGDARLARAEGLYRASLERAAQQAIEARSEVREAYGAYRHAHDIARLHRDELLPLARRIADEQLLRYNGMLVGVFELLADARAQVAAVEAAMLAQRDFWRAQAVLDEALIGRPGGTAAPIDDRSTAPAPAAAAGH